MGAILLDLQTQLNASFLEIGMTVPIRGVAYMLGTLFAQKVFFFVYFCPLYKLITLSQTPHTHTHTHTQIEQSPLKKEDT